MCLRKQRWSRTQFDVVMRIIMFIIFTPCHAQPPKQVAVIQWIELASARECRATFVREIQAESSKSQLAVDVATFNAYGDREALVQFLKKSRADLLVTIGNTASQEVLDIISTTSLIMVDVYYPDQLLVSSSKNRNLIMGSFCIDVDYKASLTDLKSIFPDLKCIGVIRTQDQLIPEMQSKVLSKAADGLGVKIIEKILAPGFCRNETDIKMALAELAREKDLEALWLLDDGNTHRFLRTLINEARQKNLKVIGSGQAVRQGADVGIEIHRDELTKQSAQQAVRFLLDPKCDSRTQYDSAQTLTVR